MFLVPERCQPELAISFRTRKVATAAAATRAPSPWHAVAAGTLFASRRAMGLWTMAATPAAAGETRSRRAVNRFAVGGCGGVRCAGARWESERCSRPNPSFAASSKQFFLQPSSKQLVYYVRKRKKSAVSVRLCWWGPSLRGVVHFMLMMPGRRRRPTRLAPARKRPMEWPCQREAWRSVLLLSQSAMPAHASCLPVTYDGAWWFGNEFFYIYLIYHDL
jgi:hypothetical protein